VVKERKKLVYVAPAVDVCRVELEGVIAETVYSIGFEPGENKINSWTEKEVGEAVHAGQGQGGDLYIGMW
jgi:hypothetical protein